GADRLGNHDARRDVSAPDRGIERPTANEVRKATSKMAIGRTEDRQNPYGELRASTPPLCLEPIRGTHLGQRSYPTARKGRTHDRKRSDCLIMPNCLAKRGPSTHVSVVYLKWFTQLPWRQQAIAWVPSAGFYPLGSAEIDEIG